MKFTSNSTLNWVADTDTHSLNYWIRKKISTTKILAEPKNLDSDRQSFRNAGSGPEKMNVKPEPCLLTLQNLSHQVCQR